MAVRKMQLAYGSRRGGYGGRSTYDNQVRSNRRNYSVHTAFKIILTYYNQKQVELSFNVGDIVVIETLDTGSQRLWPWSPYNEDPIGKYWLRGADRQEVMKHLKD